MNTERTEIFPGYFALAASFARVHEMRRRMVADDADDEPICSQCSGSGEGQHDGTTCWKCKGSGVGRSMPDPDEYDEVGERG